MYLHDNDDRRWLSPVRVETEGLGHAESLPMTDEEKEEAEKRKGPLGFGASDAV